MEQRDVTYFLPIILDADIKNWHTDDTHNNHLLHGFFTIASHSDGTVNVPANSDTILGIGSIYRVANGIILDCVAPGTLMGGHYVITNLLTIEIE